MSERTLRLFEGFGIEIEYMIVDPAELSVRPVADALLYSMAGAFESEIENDDMAWSNELALHVFEIKTNGPAPALAGLADAFQRNVSEINARLAPLGATLLPSAAHPWMDPETEFRRWPHEYGEIYETFDRIFSCVGHGWSNLQSVHLNLPFSGNDEFGRLHAAIRVLLPILPALAASSPILDGATTGLMDSRLAVYRTNARRVPSVSGQVIPEPVFDFHGYQREILEPIYRDLEPHDPKGILRHEWVNARGCIARFDRNAIEIRVLDTQECPAADLAVVAAATAVARSLVDETLSSGKAQRAIPTADLVEVLGATIRDADRAQIEDRGYLRLLGWERGPCSAAALWESLIERCAVGDPLTASCVGPLETILAQGCLARRLLARLGERIDRDRLRGVYGELAACLAAGERFLVRPA